LSNGFKALKKLRVEQLLNGRMTEFANVQASI
jgi:hypothetical protein